MVLAEALPATPADILWRSDAPTLIAAVEDILANADVGMGPMPCAWIGTVGITACGPLPHLSADPPATPTPGMPLARAIIALRMDDRSATEAAIPIIENRLAKGIGFVINPLYRDDFAGRALSIVGSEPVVLQEHVPAAGAAPTLGSINSPGGLARRRLAER